MTVRDDADAEPDIATRRRLCATNTIPAAGRVVQRADRADQLRQRVAFAMSEMFVISTTQTTRGR